MKSSIHIFSKAVVASFLMLYMGCTPRLPAPEIASSERSVLEITDLFQTGHERFVDQTMQDSLLQRTWEGRREQVVMIFIDIEWEDGEREQAQQSGIILQDGGLVLTAGHGFVIEDGTILEIRVRLYTGKEVPLTLLGFRYDKEQVPPEDWALLRPAKRLPFESFEPAGGEADRNKMMLLGYPGSLGLDSEGVVVHVKESSAPEVYPLGMIMAHHVMDQHTLFPRAGTIPLRGISGAPIFDRNGDLMGMFSSIGRRRTIKGWEYIFSMSDIPWNAISTSAGK